MSPPKKWVRHIVLVTLLATGGMPLSLAASPRDTPEIYTAALGTLYGVGDALIHGNDPLKGAWDGLMTGSMLPGALLGGSIGLSIGILVSGATLTTLSEKSCVGWGAGGAAIGSMLSTNALSTELERQMGIPLPILSTGLLGYYMVVAAEGYHLSKSAMTQLPHDAMRHKIVSRKLRDQFDPGTALMAGAFKEGHDYFLQSGTPEFRDLQNNWEGIFRGIKTY
jgi:hypothetical protein